MPMELDDEIIQNVVENIMRNLINLDSFFGNIEDDLSFDFIDPIENVLRESLENQPEPYVKTNRELLIDSKKYENIIDKKDKCCSICLTEFINDDTVSKLEKCEHVFHTECIKEWGFYMPTCPTCRTDINYK